jgi:carboxymethylenebutenolidase
VPFYGVAPHGPRPDWSKLGGPIQGHYADNDPWAGPDAVDALIADIGSAGGSAEFFVYPGARHAFFNDSDPEAHDPLAAAAAWERTISFLNANL